MGDFATGLAGGLAGGLRPEVLVPALLQRKATSRATSRQEAQRKRMLLTIRSAYEGKLIDKRKALELVLNLGGDVDIGWLTKKEPPKPKGWLGRLLSTTPGPGQPGRAPRLTGAELETAQFLRGETGRGVGVRPLPGGPQQPFVGAGGALGALFGGGAQPPLRAVPGRIPSPAPVAAPRARPGTAPFEEEMLRREGVVPEEIAPQARWGDARERRRLERLLQRAAAGADPYSLAF